MLKAIVQCCFKEYEKNFTKFIGKRFWWCGFNYSYRPRPAAFLKTELYYRCFPVKKNSTAAFFYFLVAASYNYRKFGDTTITLQ